MTSPERTTACVEETLGKPGHLPAGMNMGRITTPEEPATAPPWKRDLRRRIGVLLMVKLAALIALWSLFFSPDHRVRVTDQSMGAVFGVDDSPRAPKELPDD